MHFMVILLEMMIVKMNYFAVETVQKNLNIILMLREIQLLKDLVKLISIRILMNIRILNIQNM